jgi:hypothetical protein
MLGHVALHEERADIGIEAGRDQESGEIESRLAELARVAREMGRPV